MLAMFCLLGAGGYGGVAVAKDGSARIEHFPAAVSLSGPYARQQLLVTHHAGGQQRDVTSAAKFESLAPALFSVDPQGVVHPLADGRGQVRVTFEGLAAEVPVVLLGARTTKPVSFDHDVQPILTRGGCNSGPCHGKSRGQNGFQLSLLGFDSDFDHQALTREARGRRVFPAAPDQSLLLEKATARVPHGGGRRVEYRSPEWETLRRWIVEGASRSVPSEAALQRVTVYPTSRSMKPLETQQLVLTAHYADGTQRDVTRLAAFQSNDAPIVAVDSAGMLKAGPIPGETAVMARFMNLIATVTVTIPLAGGPGPEFYAALPRANFIDDMAWAKLQTLGLTPSARTSDAGFHRRVFLDLIGRVPTPDETREFLADASPDKRGKLVDRLLDRPEYVDFWANKWCDLLRPNPYHVGVKSVMSFDQWIRDSFRENKPYDDFVRELITARGSTWQNGAVVMYRNRRQPDELTTIVSQLFLGIRLECAKCHHHPFEVWGQDDFYSFAAYFAKIGRKGTGISAPISGSEEFVFTGGKGVVKHPLTGEELSPRPLFGDAPEITPEQDPRDALAAWITSDKNPFFAQVIVNRVWADLMGRGLVEPVDDLRGTNPPSNAPLLTALAEDFRKQKYDLKALLRRIATSNLYALGTEPNDRNSVDTRNYSRHYRKRLRAEVLHDAICDITGQPTQFAAHAPKTRAMELWTVRTPSQFLDAFGRQDPNLDPPCERLEDTTLVQALHLMNSGKLHEKVAASDGRLAEVVKRNPDNAKLIEEIYLLVYNRLPNDEERGACLGLFTAPNADRQRVCEDLVWAMFNTPEFVFND